MLRKIKKDNVFQLARVKALADSSEVEEVIFEGSETDVDAQLHGLIDSEVVQAAENGGLVVTSPNAIKALPEKGEGRIGGYLVVWGNPDRRDLQGEYFTKESDLGLDWYEKRPILYHHGLDGTVKAEVIGELDKLVEDETGLWAEGVLDLRKRYAKAVYKLTGQDVLGWSSGSLKHLVQVEQGHIKRWPIVEGSLTPTPAEFRETTSMPLKALLNGGIELSDEDEDPEADQETEMQGDSSGQESDQNNPPADETDQEDASDKKPDKPNSGVKTMDPNEMFGQFVDGVAAQMQRTLSPDQRNTAIQALCTAFGMGGMQQGQQPDPNQQNMYAAKAAEILADEDQRARVLEEAVKQVRALTEGTGEDTESLIQTTITSAFKATGIFRDQRGQAPGGSRVTGHRNTSQQITPQQSRLSERQLQIATKYHDMDHEDMAYLETMLRGIHQRQNRPHNRPPEFFRELASKASREFDKNPTVPPTVHQAIKGLADLSYDFNAAMAEVDRATAYKANELDHSTQSGYGDEWVPDLWLNKLWMRSRMENVVASSFQQIEMPSTPFELPIESTDPTVSKVPETTEESQLTISGAGNPIPDSKVATGKVTLTADKLALRVGWSTEVDEDSIIPFASQARKQGQRAMLDALDNVFLNADNTASGNINKDGGTPAATDKYMVAWKGLLYLPINTGAALAVDMGGLAPTLSQIRTVRAKLLNAYAARIDELVWFCDFPTYMKLLSIPEFLTVDKYGSQATAVRGELGKIDNIPVKISNEIALSASNGKVSSTGGNNLYGRLLLAHMPSWYIGYRRKTTVNVEYISYYDAYQMTATVRPAFINRDSQCAALLYDILV